MTTEIKTTFQSRVGEAVEFSLAENASTGYVWSIKVDDGLEVSETKDGGHPNSIGGYYSRNFNVCADKVGTYTLTAELRRPWEDTPPVEVQTFEIGFSG